MSMLTKLVVKNVRSIKKADISFEKSGIGYKNNYIYRQNYVNPVTVYGDNGSGKSLLFLTLEYLVALMCHVTNVLESIDLFPDLVLFEKRNNGEKVDIKKPIIEYSFLTKDNTKFTYVLGAVASTIITDEELIIDGKRILKRKDNKCFVEKEEFEVPKNYSAVRKIGIEDYAKDNNVMLLIKKCYEAMKKIVFVDDDDNILGQKIMSISVQDSLLKKSVSEYISNFSGLPNFNMVEKELDSGKRTIYMDFGDGRKLPFGLASRGVQREGKILSALNMCCDEEDCTVVIDEINRSIHPINLKRMVDEFINRNVQLIFSCHDTNLLRFLRPDQIYFAYFGKDLHSTFKRLNEIHPNIREINNIESMYLKGVFDEEIAE